jgi:hypothetical protein
MNPKTVTCFGAVGEGGTNPVAGDNPDLGDGLDSAELDGINLVLLVFVVLCMVVYCWSLCSFAWWLE